MASKPVLRTRQRFSAINNAPAKNHAIKTPREMKDILIRLRLEIEDSDQSIDLLEKAISREEKKVKDDSNAVDRVRREERERLGDTQKAEVNDALERIDNLLQSKQELSKDAKNILDQVLHERNETSVSIERVKAVGLQELESARVTWSEGESLRREKWLDRKVHEIRSMTLQGLEPEIKRIMEKHENTENSLREIHSERIRALEDMYKLRIDRDCSAVRESLKSGESINLDKSELTLLLERCEELKKENFNQIENLRKTMDEEMRDLKKLHQDEITRLETTTKEEIHSMREESNQRLESKRHGFESCLRILSDEHNSAIGVLKREDQIKRENWGKKFESPVQDELTEAESATLDKAMRLIREERDKNIHGSIREIKLKSTLCISELREKSAAEKFVKIENFNAKIAEIQAKISEWEKDEKAKEQLLECAKVKMKELKSELSMVEARKELANEKSRILHEEVRNGKIEFENRKEQLKREAEMTLEALTNKKINLESECIQLAEEESAIRSSGEAQLAQIVADYDHDLQALNNRVKEQDKLLSKEATEVKEKIRSLDIEIKHSKLMLKKYVKPSSPRKWKNSPKR